MTVTRDDLERQLAKLKTRVRDPRAGLYGPGSMSWRINREGIILLGGGCASLLQLAHPYVAHAVDQHSQTRTDATGRFARTFSQVFAMVFGDLDHALAAARRVHAMHTTVRGAIGEDVGRFRRGERYAANDRDALKWVLATLVQTALDVYELLVAPLTALERETYYDESRLFGYLFGLGDDVMPGSYTEFVRWYRGVLASDVIAVGEPAAAMRGFLFAPTSRAREPFVRWYTTITAGLLPAKLRAPFGFAWGEAERRAFQRSLGVLRVAHRTMPRRFKYFVAYVEAARRLEGKPEHDRFGRWLERVALRSLEPAAS
jgi:uncharacterized protein (DUF2236 family)